MADKEESDLAKARTRSVDNLQRLYTVVVSLAVTESVRRVMAALLDSDPGNNPSYQSWLMLASLIVTVVPFYHGANRYLDATYVTNERAAPASALMIDFIVLFMEGLALFALAMLVGQEHAFYTALCVLFVIDAAWVGFTQLTSTANKTADRPSYGIWATVNVVAAFSIFISFWSRLFSFELWSNDVAKHVVVFSLAAARTVYDYYSVWGFYYPSEGQSAGLIPAPLPAPPPVARRSMPAEPVLTHKV